MTTDQINVRDPFVLCHNGTYYLYGTDSATTWHGRPDGFSCWTSQDLNNWQGPFQVFSPDESFFADRNYWAPECYAFDGRFFLITTFGAPDRKKGIYILSSDSPLGPFAMHSDEALTPTDWTCIDGTLYRDDDEIPWLIFSHTFEDVPTGDMAAIPLSRDLKKPAGDPVVLFQAADAPWARPVPFAKTEFGLDGDVYFTDGPCIHKMNSGKLMNIWSAWSERGYAVGMAVSDNGHIKGPWRHLAETLFPGDGGHGMLFQTFDGQLTYTMHYPNDKYAERPIFFKVAEEDNRLVRLS